MTEQATELETPTEVPATDTPTTETPSFTLPDEYKDAAWAQGIDSNESAWKKLAGSQKLIGDRGAFIPREGATEEQVAEFMGRLEPFEEQLKGKYSAKAPESYEFSELEGGVTIDDSITDRLSEIGKKHNISNEALDGLRQDWISFETEMQAQRGEQMNTQFEAMAQEAWGDKWQDVTAEASEMMKQHVPESMRQAMVNMPNEYLVPLVATMQAMKGSPDGMPNTSGARTENVDALRTEYSRLRKEAQLDPRKREEFNAFVDKNRNAISR